MTVDIDAIDGIKRKKIHAPVAPVETLPSRELTPAEEKAHVLGTELLAQTPPSSKRNLTGGNLAWGALQAALKSEAASINKLNGMNGEVQKKEQLISTLLDLTKELNTLPKSDKMELSEKTKAILSDLKEKGIDLWDEKKTLTKQDLTELKSAIGARIDQSKTQINQIFTKIQTAIQLMTSINNIAKETSQLHTRLIRTILQFMAQK